MNNIFFTNLINFWKNISTKYGITWKNSFIQWENPKNVLADFSLNIILIISHKEKRDSKKIGLEIIKYFPEEFSKYLSWEITEKGYINFVFSDYFFENFLVEILESNGESLKQEKKKYSCQHRVCFC